MSRSSNPRVARIAQDLHFVSQTVLRGFCNEGGMLERLDVQHPTRPRLRSTKSVGYRNDLQPANPDEFESYWQPMESSFPRAMEAVRNGTVLDDEQLVDVLRDCIVVHFARSNTLETVTKAIRDPVLTNTEAKIRDSPHLVSLEGLVPVGQEARAAMAHRTMERIARERFRHEVIAPERMMATYEKVRKIAAVTGVEVLVATEGEFLIGDTPAHTLSSDNRIDVPWDQANTVTMPLDRHHAFALGRENRYIEFDQSMINFVNRVQVQTAQRFVMWHPEAQMVGFVREVLDGASE